MFRRTAAAPHPEAAVLEGSAADTVEIDPVIQSGDTSVMPPVPADPDPATEVINSITTGPSAIVHSALDVTMETPEPSADQTRVDPAEEHRRKVRAQRERPAPRRPVQWRPEGTPVMSMQTISENDRSRRPRNRPRTLDSWKATLSDIRHDRQTPFYATLIVLAAVLVCWATMVIFKPDWVPQVINPVPVHPSTSPASYHPKHQPLVPGGGLRTPQTRSQRPAGTEGPSDPRRRSETPHKSGQGQPAPGTPSSDPSTPAKDPSTTPTQGPSQSPSQPDPSSGPTHSSEPTPSDPGTPTEPTHEPTKSQEPSGEPTHSTSATPSASRSASDSPEPSHSASESPVTSPSATSS